MACAIIRKTARLASYYNSKWFKAYVQTPRESLEKIPLASQRHLINNFKNATELGAEVLQVKDSNIAKVIIETVEEKKKNNNSLYRQTSPKFVPGYCTYEYI